MNRRESILMSLVGIAALVAVGDYGYEYLKNQASDVKEIAADRELMEAREIVKNVNTALVRMQTGRSSLAVLALSERPLKRDPLVPIPGETDTNARRGVASLICSGTMKIGEMKFVLIGGDEYAEGDVIPNTNETVVTVGDDSVTLRGIESGEVREIECVGME